MRCYGADLHVHTALSPCAEPEMTPAYIIGLCLEYGIDIVAVTDHNSAANVRAMRDFAEGTGIVVWPGMEIETKEEVHVLVLGDDVDVVEEWQEFVYSHLPALPNRPEVFGEQQLFDKQGEVIGVVDRLLLTSLDLTVDDVRFEAKRRGLVSIAAHVDRPANSYLSNLGFLPPPDDFDLLEVSSRQPLEEVKSRLPSLSGYRIVVSSDAHRLTDLGEPRTRLHLARPTLDELRTAIAGQRGRRVELRD